MVFVPKREPFVVIVTCFTPFIFLILSIRYKTFFLAKGSPPVILNLFIPRQTAFSTT